MANGPHVRVQDEFVAPSTNSCLDLGEEVGPFEWISIGRVTSVTSSGPSSRVLPSSSVGRLGSLVGRSSGSGKWG